MAGLEVVEVAVHDIDEEADDVSAAGGFLLDDVCEFVVSRGLAGGACRGAAVTRLGDGF